MHSAPSPPRHWWSASTSCCPCPAAFSGDERLSHLPSEDVRKAIAANTTRTSAVIALPVEWSLLAAVLCRRLLQRGIAGGHRRLRSQPMKTRDASIPGLNDQVCGAQEHHQRSPFPLHLPASHDGQEPISFHCPPISDSASGCRIASSSLQPSYSRCTGRLPVRAPSFSGVYGICDDLNTPERFCVASTPAPAATSRRWTSVSSLPSSSSRSAR